MAVVDIVDFISHRSFTACLTPFSFGNGAPEKIRFPLSVTEVTQVTLRIHGELLFSLRLSV